MNSGDFNSDTFTTEPMPTIKMFDSGDHFNGGDTTDLYISGEEESERYQELSQMKYEEIKEIANSLGIKGIDFYGKVVTIAKIIRAERDAGKEFYIS